LLPGLLVLVATAIELLVGFYLLKILIDVRGILSCDTYMDPRSNGLTLRESKILKLTNVHQCCLCLADLENGGSNILTLTNIHFYMAVNSM
jgi:hypothetical protein